MRRGIKKSDSEENRRDEEHKGLARDTTEPSLISLSNPTLNESDLPAADII